MRSRRVALAALTMLLVSAVLVLAAADGLIQSALTGGGGRSESGGAVLLGSVGQAAVGRSDSGDAGLCVGWPGCRGVTYVQPCYTLTLSHTGNGTDPVASPANSTGCAVGHYVAGQSISFSGASPESGWQISGWIGTDDDSSTASTNSLTMPAGVHSVSVTYAEITYDLTVAVDPGGGGTTTPSAGVHTYAQGAVVDITASASSGYAFDYWSGACAGSGACQVTMDADRSVTAHFTDVTHDLTITVDPAGGGTTVPAAGVYTYAEGAVVDITAWPSSGYAFDHWSGACSDMGTCQVTMDVDKSVTAHFRELLPGEYALTVMTEGEGSVTLDPPGGVYTEGTDVELTAVAEPGWAFTAWSGDLSGDTNPVTVTMDAHKAILAHFVDDAPPDTTITTHPDDPSLSADATFGFTSSEVGSTFECQLDGGGFIGCTSPHTYVGLEVGDHTFEVRAVDGAGNLDPTPASFSWSINWVVFLPFVTR